MDWIENKYSSDYAVGGKVRGRVEPRPNTTFVAYVWDSDAIVGDKAVHVDTFSRSQAAKVWVECTVATMDRVLKEG